MTAVNLTSRKSLFKARCPPVVRTSESSLSSFHPVQSHSTGEGSRLSPPNPWPGPSPFPVRETVKSSADRRPAPRSHLIPRKIAAPHWGHTSCRCAPLHSDGLLAPTASLRSKYRSSLRHNRLQHQKSGHQKEYLH